MPGRNKSTSDCFTLESPVKGASRKRRPPSPRRQCQWAPQPSSADTRHCLFIASEPTGTPPSLSFVTALWCASVTKQPCGGNIVCKSWCTSLGATQERGTERARARAHARDRHSEHARERRGVNSHCVARRERPSSSQVFSIAATRRGNTRRDGMSHVSSRGRATVWTFESKCCPTKVIAVLTYIPFSMSLSLFADCSITASRVITASLDDVLPPLSPQLYMIKWTPARAPLTSFGFTLDRWSFESSLSVW